MADNRSNNNPDVKEKETYVVKDDPPKSNMGAVVAVILIALIIILFFVFGSFGGGGTGGSTDNGTDINVEAPNGGTTN